MRRRSVRAAANAARTARNIEASGLAELHEFGGDLALGLARQPPLVEVSHDSPGDLLRLSKQTDLFGVFHQTERRHHTPPGHPLDQRQALTQAEQKHRPSLVAHTRRGAWRNDVRDERKRILRLLPCMAGGGAAELNAESPQLERWQDEVGLAALEQQKGGEPLGGFRWISRCVVKIRRRRKQEGVDALRRHEALRAAPPFYVDLHSSIRLSNRAHRNRKLEQNLEPSTGLEPVTTSLQVENLPPLPFNAQLG